VHSHGIPAGLVRAIHARLGPGAVGFGSTPLIAGIARAGGGWNVKASAQSLAARIAPDGMVTARLVGSDAASLTPVELSSPGRSASLSAGRTVFRDGRLLVALGPATGAYQLTAGGLEQRFTVNRPLSRNANRLTLGFSSPVRWRSIRAGSAIVPDGTGAGRLAYAGLRATDAHGRVLRSRFALTARGPEIVTNTERAVYPITIDPTWTTTSTPTTSLFLGVNAGYAVALSEDGTTALVGAESAAYVFHSSGGSWASSSTPTATLTDGTESVDAEPFGSSVALSSDGTTALVGVPGAGNGYGAAYVYNVAAPGSWTSSSTPTATLKDQTGGLFGSSVSLSSNGRTALIGAPSSDSFKGAAYVFEASSESALATSSVPTASLTDSSGAVDDTLGSSVALSSDGTTAFVGDPDVNNATGAVDVFQVSSDTSWGTTSMPTATLTNSSGQSNDSLGSALSLSSDGKTALIGASGAGVVYVFEASAETAWTSSVPVAATLGDGLGDLGASASLSSDGTTALLGGGGAAYIFRASAEGSWMSNSNPAVTLSDSEANDNTFGSAVALSPDGMTALIGVPNANNGTGLADLFHASMESSWATSALPAATLTGPSGAPTAKYGYSVALSSDGTTALVGSEGAAYIFQTSSEGSWASNSAATASLVGAPGDSSEVSVALSANGTTALIGDPDVNSGAGAAYVFHVGSETSWASSSAPTATLTSGSGSFFNFGSAVSLSSDGTTALIGAVSINLAPGAAYVFNVSSQASWVTSAMPAATLTNSAVSTDEELGYSVALSSDGTTALIGAPGNDAAYVFQATANEDSWATTSSTSTPIAALTSPSSVGFGASVSLSEDGTTALVGAPGGPESIGTAYVYNVSSETSWMSSSAPNATLMDGSNNYDDGLGSGVALSQDGKTALVGADSIASLAGAAYVFQATSETSWTSSSTPIASLSNSSGSPGDRFGSAVALSSDATTALIGAYEANNGTGGVYVYAPPSATYTLTADKSGTGTGTVTTTDSAIDCGSTCTATYGTGSQVTLNAQPGLNSAFTGWSGGGCSGTSSCTTTIVADTTVTATFGFVAPPKSLTVTLTGSAGSVSSDPAGISCPGTCAADFSPGTTVTLTATPASGGTFAGWSGPACKVTNSGGCSVTTSSTPQSLSATFTTATVLPQEALRVSLAGAGTGSVSSSPAGISCPGTCTAGFAQGTVVTLTPSPGSGSSFAGWSGAGCSGTGACNVSMSAAQTVTGTFTAVSAKPSCTLVPQGAKVSVPAKPSKKHPLSASLKVAARCDQSAAVKVTGTITAARMHAKTQKFTVTAVTATVKAGKTDTVTVKLPKSALTALEAGAHESVAFKLRATSADGSGTAAAKIGRLKLVKISA
jgi:hypothetical protein